MAAPILLTSITGESCKPRTDLDQCNTLRAPHAENRPHGVIVAAAASPPATPTSLSQPETSMGTPIGAPDLRHQKDKPRLRLCSPSSSLPHASQRHTNLTAGRAPADRDVVHVQPAGSTKGTKISKTAPPGGKTTLETTLPSDPPRILTFARRS